MILSAKKGSDPVEKNTDIRNYWEIIKRRKFQFIIPGLVVFFLAAFISLILPPVYKSTGTILIETQEIPEDFVRSTVTGYVEERLQAIAHIVLSRAKLLEIMNRFNLYQDLKDRYSTEEIIEKMRGDITMEPIQTEITNPQSGRPGSATVAFTVSYEGKDPQKVAQVANVLASLYLEENLKNREEQARTTFEFLEDQLAELRAEIVSTEKRIAQFKNEHVDHLPELMQLNLQTMDQLQRQIDAKEEQIKTLINREIYLKGQLAAVEPFMYTVSLDGKRVMTAKEELEALRSQYLSLSATLSNKHPDVIALKKRLDAMETEVDTRQDLRERYRALQDKEAQLALISKKFSPQHPDVIRLKKEVGQLKAEVEALSAKQTVLKGKDEHPENPSYINLQTQIESTQMEIDTGQKELGLLKEKYEDYRRRVEKTPQVEQEYRALERDYANAQAKYKDTMNRLLAAREAKGLEESRKGERFTLVDPPVMPEKPDRPNRFAILLIGVVLGMGSGIGFGSMAEYMDQSVHRADELAAIAGHPVLAVIPYVKTRQEWEKTRRKKWAYIGVTVGFIITVIATVHFFYRPLDILWIQMTRSLSVGF